MIKGVFIAIVTVSYEKLQALKKLTIFMTTKKGSSKYGKI